MKPTPDQAYAFAVMLGAGLPASDAILYFTNSDDSRDIAEMLKEWQTSLEVRKAQLKLNKKSWQEMSLDERIRTGLDQHYNSLAYLLFSRNYVEVSTTDKAKLDSARVALEAKVAGTSGQMSELDRFLNDINNGKLRLPAIPIKN